MNGNITSSLIVDRTIASRMDTSDIHSGTEVNEKMMSIQTAEDVSF